METPGVMPWPEKRAVKLQPHLTMKLFIPKSAGWEVKKAEVILKMIPGVHKKQAVKAARLEGAISSPLKTEYFKKQAACKTACFFRSAARHKSVTTT